jgi:hypothetical protein
MVQVTGYYYLLLLYMQRVTLPNSSPVQGAEDYRKLNKRRAFSRIS